MDQVKKCSYTFGIMLFILKLEFFICNRIIIKYYFPKSLDEIHIEVETCENLRDVSTPQGLSSYAGPTKYSFIHKVIDGITVYVNTVSITFKSPAFVAKVKVY